MLSVSSGYDPRYLTAQVGAGAEGYYLRGVGAGGEPPGRWVGAGAAALGLTGEVDPTVMEALYGRFVDPRDPRVVNRGEWGEAAKLGKPPRKFKSLEERLAAALAAEPDASPERVAEIRAQVAQSQRQAVHFLDLTFSPQKSVSVLWASFASRAAEHEGAMAALGERLAQAPEGGAEWRRLETELGAARAAAALWRQRADVVWGAIEAGADAALDYARREAGYARAGYHGRLASGATVGRFVEAPDWIVARFAHHESRDHDVQLHLHHAILNRVRCADGEWRTLDSRAVHRVRPAAAAVGERVVEDYLTRELGVEWATRPDGKAREIVGMGQDMRDLF
ncbi:MAG TPA: relaxase domain-containing protein, partial [Gemmatimonadales bacterium]|nr:relaxase domain-containing protein [Gemmatimonadales bacterium]